ncbi:hypothetical protein HK407_01g00220 [Ordospora pajunii]|uniref:uncharacterized protein n=1 Tax=Ordospora pajunii TaxID=3039483 RepID=UPI0029526DB7|nr:uncharacterized protein HK407_01g00220 [Ordospora pajunii]KAH9412130.1 hypothetical protein HK407_01g00220 [Ordospora pajunii]
MNNYDAINDEIKSFLCLADRQPSKNAAADGEKTDECSLSLLIHLLTNLQNVYAEINTNLAAGDCDGLKNVLLSSDVKMSLVSESLMRVLKEVSQEKCELMQSEEGYKEKIRRLSEEKTDLEIRINKFESDLEFANRGNQELSRIIRDQKSKMQEQKEKADLEKRNCDSFRMINNELEVLRKKALEKCDVYEKEICVLKEHIKGRSEEIGKMKEAVKQGEAEKEALSQRLVGIEKINEQLRKKMDVKDNALELCNSELSKLILKEKRAENEMETMKEKTSYYEKLYKATNSQNEYLNSQLAKMIRDSGNRVVIPEYDPEAHHEVTAIEDEKASKTSDRSYLKRLNKYKRRSNQQKEINEKQRIEVQDLSMMTDKLKGEVLRLQEERSKTIEASNRITNELMSKVEKLLEQSREYQGIIYELKAGRHSKESKGYGDGNGNESFKTVNDGEDDFILNKNSERGMRYGNDEELKFESLMPVTLENDYENVDVENGYDIMGKRKTMEHGISNINTRLNVPVGRSERELANPGIKINLPESFYSSLTRDGNVGMNNEEGMRLGNKEAGQRQRQRHTNAGMSGEKKIERGMLIDPFESMENARHLKETDEKIESDSSVASPKTVRTTSTLHSMLKRTDALQERFERLEGKLKEIRSSDKVDEEKMHDQIQAYKNYYYSDFLDISNQSDVI